MKRQEAVQQVVQQAPPPAPKAPVSLTLRQGVVAGHLAIEISVSSDNVLAPVSIAPDLHVGVLDDLTLSLVHSSSALTGFRGSAGAGVCVSGEDKNCRTTYASGGVEALYTLTRGSAAVAANAGILWTTIDPVHTDLKLGFKLRLSEGAVFATFSPNVWLALDDRFDRIIAHEHQLWLPIGMWLKTTPEFAVGVGTGVKGPLKNFGDRMSIPAGLAGQYSVSSQLGFGASLVFGKVLGGSDVMDLGFDARVVQVWLNVASG